MPSGRSGKNCTDMELLSFDNTRAVLEELAEEIRTNYRDHLMEEGHYTTLGSELRLVDSITAKVELEGETFVGTLSMNDYWKYVEEGISPAGQYGNPGWKAYPFISRWIEIKPVIPRPSGNGKIPSQKSLAYLITRKIKEYGIEGTHDLQKTKDAIIPFFVERIKAALKEDLSAYIIKFLDESVIDWE